MGVYSIKDLENFTQIKAHTLRIWEQRYKLLSPERTETNIRLYSDRDLKKILNINLLYNNGLKISKIAELRESEIVDLANKILCDPLKDESNRINFIIGKIIDFDERSIRSYLDDLMLENPLEIVFSEVLIPILEKIGELWQVETITVAHEHFFSLILRDYVISKTAIAPVESESRGKVLLFLREGEYHELGVIYYNHVLRSKGYTTYYLGQSLPNEDVKVCIQRLKPDFIFTSLIAQLDENEINEFMHFLGELIDFKQVYIGGFQLKFHRSNLPKDLNIIESFKDFDKF